ncbi:MAG: AhpC/TSA family protein [Sphingobacteriia bacterium]|nr:MAG: AhpC/TSA family protein [Sphingobacteriia bacterium]
MRKSTALCVLWGLMVLAACQQNKYGGFTLSGTIKNAPSPRIYLQELPFGGEQPVVLDSALLSAQGRFTLKAVAREEGLYRVVIENGPDVLIVNDGKSIELNLDIKQFRQYKITGSAASLALHEFFEAYRSADSRLYAQFQALDTLQGKPGQDSLVAVVKTQREEELKKINELVRQFINKSESPAARYYALGMASRTMGPDELKALANASAAAFPDHSGIQKLKALVNEPVKTVAPPAVQAPKPYFLLQQPVPLVSGKTPEGKVLSLEQFKGKYVLLDFWASWCPPCRAENPEWVKLQAKYAAKNFTMFGFSLDSDSLSWAKAIQTDKLAWPQISDLKEWESPLVSRFQFEAIPFNVFIDPTGKIIGASLSAKELDAKLAVLLEK